MSTLEELKAKLRSQTSEAKRINPLAPVIPLKKLDSVPSIQSAALFLGTEDDEYYKHELKGMFAGVPTYTLFGGIQFLTHLAQYCRAKNIKSVVSTDTGILSKLLEIEGNFKSDPKLNDYAGSVFTYESIEIVFISPLRNLKTVPYGPFLTARYISKVVRSSAWIEATEFKWELVDSPTSLEHYYDIFQTAIAIACDIETFKQHLAIRCIGYTGIFIRSDGSLSTISIVIPLDCVFNLEYCKKFNALPAAKIFQNGKYDNSYLLRYNAPVNNWLWDTMTMMHCWYSEMPKDLAFINAFFLRKVVYWKDLAETNDLKEYYRYNAMDTWATANVFIAWILTAPNWARRNYELEFPLVFPCLLAEMTGIERDMDALQRARQETIDIETKLLTELRTCLGIWDFNPGSPQQVVKMLKLLGLKDAESSNEKELKKAQLVHPLINHLVKLVIDIREVRNRRNKYLRTDDDKKKDDDDKGAKEFHGRILSAFNPHGTDTGRLASREHHFWTGLQLQNIERGPEVKQTLRASNGFYLAESDLEQAESRDTAYISGDLHLIAAVESDRDFHSVNCSAFFGVPYESIYDDSTGKTLDKKLRDTAKRVNHGANYNMTWFVLIDTMGLDKIWEAGRMLRLPFTDARKIAEYLLYCFHKTYPGIKGVYYVSVVNEIGTTSKLVSRVFHHTSFNESHYTEDEYISSGDWTRYCFGRPDKNKSDLNAYVAHCPQSLNARTLNEAWMRVFYEIALPNPLDFRLHAQIHDSILFSYKAGREDLAHKVREIMEIPITIRDVSGVVRKFVVPAALKLGLKDKQSGELKRAIHWSETE